MTASCDDLCVPGFVATHVHQMYADATEYHLVVPFQDRDTYCKNADDPAQDPASPGTHWGGARDCRGTAEPTRESFA
jgi:hypothetical protein